MAAFLFGSGSSVLHGEVLLTNDEALTGEVEIANYSESDLNGKQLSWVLTDSKQQVLDKGVLPLQVKQGELAKVGTLKPAIASVRKAEKVTLALSIDGTPYRNDYSLWIYPADKEVTPSEDICVTDDLDAHLKYLTEGGKVLGSLRKTNIRIKR